MMRTQIVLAPQASAGFDMHEFYIDFISGVSLGVKLFLGDGLMEGDKFAISIDLLMVNITYVISESEQEEQTKEKPLNWGFFYFFFFLALLMAIAMACFCG